VAFDAFGHVYVLDRSSVLVFSADGSRLITRRTSTCPEPVTTRSALPRSLGRALVSRRASGPLVDSIGGTAQYLTGVAAEASGDAATAEKAWRQAAQSEGTLLIEDAPDAIKELSEQRLNQLSSTGRRLR